MRKIKIIIATALALGSLFFFSGCVSVAAPKGYVPDEKVVFLKEKSEFGPIRYDPITTDPYVFEPDAGVVQIENPSFLRITNFGDLLKPDFAADSRLYREAAAYLSSVAASPAVAELRTKLDSTDITAPPPLPAEYGELTTEYSNAKQYAYPGSEGARITIMNSGDYKIDFPDKSSFVYFMNGSYYRRDASDTTMFAYDTSDQSVITQVDGDLFSKRGGFRRITSSQGTLEYNTKPSPQYRFTSPGSPLQFTLFVTPEGEAIEYSVVNASNISFDYLIDSKNVLVTVGDRAILVDSGYRKQQAVFDTKANEMTEILSVFLPEGVRFSNLKGPSLAYSEIVPAWPEGYKSKSLGPFMVLYTDKDSDLLSKLDPSRLTEIEAAVRKLSGLDVVRHRVLIFPPDLETYCKLSASEPKTRLNWYPSGFQTKDYIVMWPLSVPRYNTVTGQEYFFGQELYEILTHEYVHLAVGENSGLLCPVPVWLNEGLAVYVESQISPETKAYWELTFFVAKSRNRLLNWDDATIHSTGDFDISGARTQYAQSYAFVKTLIEEFGLPKVVEYVKSFRVPVGNISSVDLKLSYKENFTSVFGVAFEEGLKRLDEAYADVKF